MFVLFGQNTNGRWTDLFSYSDVKYLEEVQGILYCGTENGVFLFDSNNPEREWIKYNKTNVLSNVGVSAMEYDSTNDLLIIGYENGAIDLLKEGQSQIVLDIPWNNFTGSKAVNHIFIKDNVALISGYFGIASYDLENREFLETTFFYQNGNYLAVNESVIYNERVYATTNNGIYSHAVVDGVNYPNFYDWQIVPNTNGLDANHVEIFNNEFYFSTSLDLYKINANNQLAYVVNINGINDLNVNADRLAVATNYSVEFFDANFARTSKAITYQQNNQGTIQTSTMLMNTGIFHNNKYFGGTAEFGLVDFDLSSTYYDNPVGYLPDGPYNNLAWAVTAKNQKVWIAPGAIDDFNAPRQNRNGFYYFDKFKWKHFKTEDLFFARDIVRVAVDPSDDNHFVAASYSEFGKDESTYVGAVEINLNEDSFQANHIIAPLDFRYRLGGVEFSPEGNLYLTSSFSDESEGYKVNHYYERKGTSWKKTKSYKSNPSTALGMAFSTNYFWFANARTGGVTVLDKNMTEVTNLYRANAELYEDSVMTVAMDQNNNLWIGSLLGLTVLYNADAAIEAGNLRTEPVVIIQDGIPEALLTSTRINDIKVDKANRKWIATNASGVYYVSDSGEETIHHFTSRNSPLPSDIVYDIDIDDTTGKVYFATDKGVVVFNGDVQDIGDKFDKVIAYPNPVRPGYKGYVVIKNIPNNASVKITDVTGNLMYDAKSRGGIVEWDTKNNKGKEVASGIYIVLMTNADGTETKTLKIAVVR